MNIRRIAIASVLIINILATSCLPIESEFILGDNVTVGNNLFVTNRAYGGHDPIADNEYTTKNYVDSVAGGGGGAGNVTTAGGIAARIPYYTAATNIEETTIVYNAASGNVTMQNNLTVNGRAYGGHDPIDDNEFTTKNYVDSVAGGGAVVPITNTYTVGPTGCNYTTIQAALNANPVANTLFLVYPATYTNDTINFTANGQSISGVGTYAKQIVTSATAAVVNFAAYTGCSIRDMTVRITAATSAIATVNGSTGTICLYDSAVEMTNSNVVTVAQPTCITTTGAATVNFINGFLNYTNNVATTAGAGIKSAVNPGAGSTTTFRRAAITLAGAGASELMIPIYQTNNCITQFYRCRIVVTDLDTTAAIGFSWIDGGSGTGEYYSNTCHVTCGAGAGHEADGLIATGTRSIRSMYNYIALAGNTQYPFQVDTGATVVSEFDDIVSTGASLTSGTGVLKFINSIADGSLKVSGNIKAATENVTSTLSVGGSITAAGGINMASKKITNLADPTSQHDAAHKAYVDNNKVGGSGTTNTIPRFSASTTLANSIITQNAGATQATITGGLSVTENITMAAGKLVDGIDLSENGLPMELMRRVQGKFGFSPLYSDAVYTGSASGWSVWGSNSMSTGVTTGSTGTYYSGLVAFQGGSGQTDFTKKHILIFNTSTDGDYDANTKYNIQFKDYAATVGADLAAQGFGMQLANQTWSFESYGTARKSTALGFTQTAWLVTPIMIVHDPTVPKLEVYVGNFNYPRYTETTSNKIPQAVAAGGTNYGIRVYITNGAGIKNWQVLPPTVYYIEY